MEQEIIRLYLLPQYSLRLIAKELGTNHHYVKRVLIRNGVELVKKKRFYRPSEEVRLKMSLAKKGKESKNKGKKAPKLSLYKNMISHLKYNVTLDWVLQFQDIEKLKYLNKSISRSRDADGYSDSDYMFFIEKFYHDKRFNDIYDKWILQKHDKYLKPSLDHIIPKSKGGSLSIENLQFLTWFENRCKNDISGNEWESMKLRIYDYFV